MLNIKMWTPIHLADLFSVKFQSITNSSISHLINDQLFAKFSTSEVVKLQ